MKTQFQPRENQILIDTADLSKMKGMYLAENLKRTWSEDFVDEDTGEAVKIERNEFLFYKGTLIDDKTLSEINFFLQSNDIKSVKITDQERTGTFVKSNASVYQVTSIQGTKKQNYYLYANSALMALNIATDVLEQLINGSFSIINIKEVGYSNLLPSEEESHKEYYKIEICVSFEDRDPYNQTYILQADDADEAKEIINTFISTNKERFGESAFETKIISAKTIPCNNIVNYEFSKIYFEKEQM